MINYGNGLVGFILTFISLISASFAVIISFIVILTVIYHQYHNRLKKEEKITLILSTNIYIFVLIFMIVLIEVNIETLIGDVYGNNFDSSLCVFRGYFIASIGCAVYHAFMTQGFFHLCRVVYANYRWLQLYWFYIVIGPIQLVIGFILMMPLLIWNYIIYSPNNHYCFISYTNFHSILWISCIMYSIPLICLLIIYIRIVRFIRQHANNQTDIVKQRQHRHLLAIRRMFISISILLALGLPAVVLVIMFFITNVESPLVHRIVWMGAEVGGAVLSVQMVLMTPQLKTIFISRRQQNRVVPAARPLQIRVPATVE